MPRKVNPPSVLLSLRGAPAVLPPPKAQPPAPRPVPPALPNEPATPPYDIHDLGNGILDYEEPPSMDFQLRYWDQEREELPSLEYSAPTVEPKWDRQ